jgi:hypothetical protein
MSIIRRVVARIIISEFVSFEAHIWQLFICKCYKKHLSSIYLTMASSIYQLKKNTFIDENNNFNCR